MKYKGKKLEGRNTDILVLMRGEERIVLKAEALENFDEFEKLCAPPEAPILMRPGGIKESNLIDPAYLKRLEEFAEKKTDYTIIKSLEITEDLEWDSIDITKPETWNKWRKELTEADFTEIEIMRILQLCISVNCLDDKLLSQAKDAFLAEGPLEEK